MSGSRLVGTVVLTAPVNPGNNYRKKEKPPRGWGGFGGVVP